MRRRKEGRRVTVNQMTINPFTNSFTPSLHRAKRFSLIRGMKLMDLANSTRFIFYSSPCAECSMENKWDSTEFRRKRKKWIKNFLEYYRGSDFAELCLEFHFFKLFHQRVSLPYLSDSGHRYRNSLARVNSRTLHFKSHCIQRNSKKGPNKKA